jgi:hypothetical protein
MAAAENISNNRDSNIVIGGFLDHQGVKIINFEGGEKTIKTSKMLHFLPIFCVHHLLDKKNH